MTILSRWMIGEGKLNMRLENADVDEGKVTLQKGGSVSFDTYFNSFSEAIFKAKTSVQKVYVLAKVEGAVRIEVYSSSRANDGVKDTLICQKEDLNTQKRTVEVPFSLTDGSFVWCKLIALSDRVKLFDGGYGTLEEKKRNVSLAVVICTFKREEYVKSNVKSLCDFARRKEEDVTVYVIDNGQTLKSEDVEGALLFSNKNLGGSGGFTRGMIEAYRAQKHTHVLLMDDDISFSPEIVARTMRLLEYANCENVAIGGGMLREDEPNVLYELGGLWNGDRLHAFYDDLDVSQKDNLLFDRQDKPDYCAWWYCCMPIGVIDRHGLPLALFIKNDDVEYGMRCKELDWTFLNGVGVYHSPFEAKYNASLEYYIRRNELVSNCFTSKKSGFKYYFKLVRSVAYQLVAQRYFAIPYAMKGYDDFLKGANYLASVDAEKLNSELRKGMPKTYSKAELEQMGFDLSNHYASKPRSVFLQTITLNGYLIPKFLCKKDCKNVRVIDSTTCKPRDFFLSKKVLQYNPLSETGFFTQEKFGEVVKTGFLLLGKAFKMLFKYGAAKRSFLKEQKYLTSFEFWTKTLGL